MSTIKLSIASVVLEIVRWIFRFFSKSRCFPCYTWPVSTVYLLRLSSTVFASFKLALSTAYVVFIPFPVSLQVPSASPANVRLTEMTSASLTYHWGEVPCGDRRGVIYDYEYELRRADGQTISDHTNGRTVTLYFLTPNTTYSFHVAARNSAGVGGVSSGVRSTTLAERLPVSPIGNYQRNLILLVFLSCLLSSFMGEKIGYN